MLKNFLLHGSNTVLILAVAVLLAAGAAGAMHLRPWLVPAGALLFYLSEYGTHRFLFHARPAANAWLRGKQHRLHYDHHVTPDRVDLLFLPLWYVVPNIILVYALAFAVLRDHAAVLSLLLGAMLALLHYEWTHFIAHQPYTPKTVFGRWTKRAHLRHHFVNEKLWYGVSNPLIDYVYGTHRDRAGASRSPTTRVLYPDQPASE